MDVSLLSQAKERVPNIPLLVNLISRRVRQLNAGHRPLVKPKTRQSNMDVALCEVADGSLTAEMVHNADADADPLIQL